MLSAVPVLAHPPNTIFVPQDALIGKKYRYGHVPVQKPQYFGIEVNGPFVWKDWIPGREYTKQIMLKNVKFRSDTIEFNIPGTRVFTTVYPKKVKISAGTSYCIPVTFRPLETLEYQDAIPIKTKEGEFTIPLRAVLPIVEVSIPTNLVFGMCAVLDQCSVSFELKNSGGLPLEYQWENEDPYTIEPESGSVDAGGIACHTVTFKPTNGLVYESDITLKYGTGLTLTKSLKLHGIGKYPHILVSAHGSSVTVNHDEVKATVDFWRVAVGDVKEKWVDLHNLSPVKCPFKVEYSSKISRIDTVFTSPNIYGVVDAMTTISIPLMYTPKMPYTSNSDYINIIALGNRSKSVVKCTGTSTGPVVQFSCDTINFNIVEIGDKKRLSATLVNVGAVAALYQFCVDSSQSVFTLDTNCGEIGPNDTKQIVIEFEPTSAINYYKRISCMIHNQGAIFLDLLGTCHSDFIKPATLFKHHIARYRRNVENNVSHYPPEQLKQMLQENKVYTEEGGSIKFHKDDELNPVCKLDMSNMDEFYNGGYFYLCSDKCHVSLDANEVDFGECANIRSIENKTIYLSNHTRGKVTVNWISDEKKTFSVFPVSIDIPAEKTMAFQLSFKPMAPNQLYATELECYVSYKTLRDYTLVEEATFTPPWCLTLNCVGQTFAPNYEKFIPRCTITPDTILFPPANENEAVYRTMVLTNDGSTPLMFDIQPDSVFSVKPTQGLVPVGCHKVLVLRALPTSVKSYKTPLNVRLNQSQNSNQKVELFLPCETANVLLDNKGEIFFKPTCVWSTSVTSYTFRNVSRIPISYEWRLSTADSRILSVNPASGVIHPNEIATQNWIFNPKTETKLVAKIQLITWGYGLKDGQSGGKKKVYTVRAMGEGAKGLIKAEQSYMNIGNLTVGCVANRQITIYNSSDCSLDLKLYVLELHETEGESKDDDSVASQTRASLIFDEPKPTTLAARTRTSVRFTVSPHECGEYQFAISYKLLTPQGEKIVCLSPSERHLCHVLVSGVYPSLVITDITCQGSNKGIGRRQMWSLLSLDSLNEYLDTSPHAKELECSVASRPSYNRGRRSQQAILDFSFGAAPIDSEPAVVAVKLENPGPVTTDWHFLLPSDLELELQYWTETADFTDKELHEMQVQNNSLFEISPQSGRMLPGESCSVTFTYHHRVACTNRLPVMLRLTRGREILINFIGVTVEEDRRYIHFPSNQFQFTPVPVGQKNTPIQMYELYNGGAVPLSYFFDLTPLAILKQENFDQDILECLDPSGEIAPCQTVQIRWRFKPIEAKTYSVNVPVCVKGGDCEVVTFTGNGFDGVALGDTLALTSIAEHSQSVPESQTITLTQQLAYLSRDRINLGDVPLYSQSRSIVFVINKSSKYTISYTWKLASKSDSCTLTIYPTTGQLAPGESTLCRVIFTALGDPSFHDIDLVCEVKNETMFAKYDRDLEAWQNEQYRLRTEFTLTENNPHADRMDTPGSSIIMERPNSGQLEKLTNSMKYREETRLPKYKTLPPIKLTAIEDWYTQYQQHNKSDPDLWLKPTEPLPYLLHLGVTARSHEVRDFQINFPDNIKYFFVNRFLSSDQRGITSPRRSAKKRLQMIVCKEVEKHMLTTVMGNVVRCLMDDAYFQDAIFSLANEGIPYYVQFTKKNHPRYPPTHPEIPKNLESVSLPAVLDGDGYDLKDIVEVTDAESELTQRSTFSFGPEVASSPRKPDDKTAIKTSELSQQTLACIEKEGLEYQTKQYVKKLSEVGHSIENCVENTIMNIMKEALSRELNLTARPCFAALPARKKSPCKEFRFSLNDPADLMSQSAEAHIHMYAGK